MKSWLRFFVKKGASLSFAFFTVPLHSPDGWHPIPFNNVASNQVEYSPKGLNIKVNKSALPLLYPFDKPKKVTNISIKAQFSGSFPQIPFGKVQGMKNWDDFVLRVGLVVRGPTRLNWLQRQFVPNWLIQMESLTSSQYGIKEVLFLTTCQQQKLLNKTKEHLMDSHFKQRCIELINSSGEIKMEYATDSPLELLGLWVGSDGDQMGGQFNVLIQEIKISYR